MTDGAFEFAMAEEQLYCPQILSSTCDLESYANRPYLLKFERGLLAYELSLVPRLTNGSESAGVHNRLRLVGAFSLLLPESWPNYLKIVVRRSPTGRGREPPVGPCHR